MKDILQMSAVVAGNTTTANVLAGTRMETAPKNGILDLYCTGSALGLQVEMFIAGANPLMKSSVNAQNRFPVVPDDLMLDDAGAGYAEKIQLSVTNTTGGSLTFFFRVELDDADYAY